MPDHPYKFEAPDGPEDLDGLYDPDGPEAPDKSYNKDMTND